MEKEAAAERDARQDRELGKGVGRVHNGYTKLLGRARRVGGGGDETQAGSLASPASSARSTAVPPTASASGTASLLLDCYLKAQGMPS